MITYIIKKDNMIDITVNGHAHSHYNGFDPICGIVSALVQTACDGCSNFVLCNMVIDKGFLKFTCPYTIETNAIVVALEKGLKEVEKQFPGCLKGA